MIRKFETQTTPSDYPSDPTPSAKTYLQRCVCYLLQVVLAVPMPAPCSLTTSAPHDVCDPRRRETTLSNATRHDYLRTPGLRVSYRDTVDSPGRTSQQPRVPRFERLSILVLVSAGRQAAGERSQRSLGPRGRRGGGERS